MVTWIQKCCKSLIHPATGMFNETSLMCLHLCLRPHFSLDVKTTSSKGLILHVAGAGAVPLMALYMANGKIRMALGQNRTIQHKQKSNDGNWHRVTDHAQKPLQQSLLLYLLNFFSLNNIVYSDNRGDLVFQLEPLTVCS